LLGRGILRPERNGRQQRNCHEHGPFHLACTIAATAARAVRMEAGRALAPARLPVSLTAGLVCAAVAIRAMTSVCASAGEIAQIVKLERYEKGGRTH
jgi:hypothetical protein